MYYYTILDTAALWTMICNVSCFLKPFENLMEGLDSLPKKKKTKNHICAYTQLFSFNFLQLPISDTHIRGMKDALSTLTPFTAQSFRPPCCQLQQGVDRPGFPSGWGHRLKSHPSSGVNFILMPSCKRAWPPQPTRIFVFCGCVYTHMYTVESKQ